MTTLENKISTIKVMSQASCPFPLKSREDIYKDLEVPRQQIRNGEHQEVGEFIARVRKEYGI